ncbi:MAG TPA: pitrilysin family protein, partial [Acetobacteraceae bacterium]|nr:pitrilysin family protein [Acetobacteraceae bacterium]
GTRFGLGGRAGHPHVSAMPQMTRRTALVTAASAAALAPVPLRRSRAQAAPARAERPLFGAAHWRLPNGLQVVFVENRRAPVIAQFLFYAAGGGEDPPGRSGVAHFLEHMMFKGSPNVASGAFSRVVAREGGNDNAFTSRDVTAYFQQVEASRLPLVMRMESDRFAGALIPADELEAERQVVLEERRTRTDNSPRALFQEAMGAALWGRQHSQGRPIIGWEEEIRATTRDDLVGFYRRFYMPANAILAISGDVREAELRRLVEEHYGPVAAHPAPARNRMAPPPAVQQARLERRDARIREAVMIRAWMAPSIVYGATEHGLPLEVLAHILGSGQGSRLYRALVDAGLATSAGAGYDSDSVGATEFAVWAAPRRGVEPARVEEVARDEVTRIVEGGVTEEEVARATRQMTAGALLALDSLGAVPRVLGSALAIGIPLDDIEYWPSRIRAVTREQVERAARAVLPTSPDVTGWLLPGTV